MNEQERRVIDDIFRRLEQVANHPRDPEAERYIADRLRQQPYAPYAMAQAIVVQEQALANLSEQVEQLHAELERLQRRPQGGIFGGLFGGGARPEPSRPPGASPGGRPDPRYAPPEYEASRPPGASPWGRPGPEFASPGHAAPQGPGPGGFGGPWGQRGGGGFLQTAMSTAAGVAGGMIIANALSHAFGGESGAASAQGLGGFGGLGGGDNARVDAGQGSNEGITDSLYQNAAEDEQDDDPGDDFNGDSGDDGDWT
jgi:hypothetical protein